MVVKRTYHSESVIVDFFRDQDLELPKDATAWFIHRGGTHKNTHWFVLDPHKDEETTILRII